MIVSLFFVMGRGQFATHLHICVIIPVMTNSFLFHKYLIILLLLAFLGATAVVSVHHHDKKAPSDICQICDFANIHFSVDAINIYLSVDFIVIPLIILYFSTYKYRLDNIFRNKAPPYII